MFGFWLGLEISLTQLIVHFEGLFNFLLRLLLISQQVGDLWPSLGRICLQVCLGEKKLRVSD